MIENLHQLEEAIQELKITSHCKLRISRDGEELFKIIGLTCIEDGEKGLMCDIHLESQSEPNTLN